MNARTPPPRPPGLRKLDPELARIVEGLARAQEERDYRAAQARQSPSRTTE